MGHTWIRVRVALEIHALALVAEPIGVWKVDLLDGAAASTAGEDKLLLLRYGINLGGYATSMASSDVCNFGHRPGGTTRHGRVTPLRTEGATTDVLPSQSGRGYVFSPRA